MNRINLDCTIELGMITYGDQIVQIKLHDAFGEHLSVIYIANFGGTDVIR